jgi:predicted transposase YdaD
MGINKQYKDSVFSLLFSNPDTLRELYSALEGVPLSPDAKIEINTLSDVLFMEQINDISFVVDNKLVLLIEHQSTINPNMPLRLLMYVARVYEKIIGNRKMYSGKQLHIPRPEFIVLYNGVRPYPDETRLKLSDAFEDIASLGLDAKVELELAVKVYNINQGYNEERIRQSETLKGYSVFVGKVREYQAAGQGKKEAMTGAVTWCIEHNILRTFLERNSTEVMNMLLTEWNMEDALAVRWEEGREEGREEGQVEGQVEAIKKLLAYGMTPEQVSEMLEVPLEMVMSQKRRLV